MSGFSRTLKRSWAVSFVDNPVQSVDARRKAELVMRVIDGEQLDAVARDGGVTVDELQGWYSAAPRILVTGGLAKNLNAFSCPRCRKKWVWQGPSKWSYLLRLPLVMWHTKLACRAPRPLVERLQERAVIAAKKGQFDRAIRDLKEALRLEPERARELNVKSMLAATFVNRGNALMDEGKYDFAIEDFDAAVALEPSHVDAFVNRSTAWGAKGDHDRAIMDCDRAIELNPSDGMAFNNRGCAYMSKSDCIRAAMDFDEAVRLEPANSMFRNNRDIAWQSQQSSS